MEFKNLEDMMNIMKKDLSDKVHEASKEISKEITTRANKEVEFLERQIQLIENDEYEPKPFERCED